MSVFNEEKTVTATCIVQWIITLVVMNLFARPIGFADEDASVVAPKQRPERLLITIEG
jgi:hypothetical protein